MISAFGGILQKITRPWSDSSADKSQSQEATQKMSTEVGSAVQEPASASNVKNFTSSPEASNRSPSKASEPNATPKRGRGRPPKAAGSAAKKRKSDVASSGEKKKGRGRPKGSSGIKKKEAAIAVVKPVAASGSSGRGRPPKSDKESGSQSATLASPAKKSPARSATQKSKSASPAKSGEKRGRGRPPKTGGAKSPAKTNGSPAKVVVKASSGRGRGRPPGKAKKVATPVVKKSTGTGKRGRPKKTVAAAAPAHANAAPASESEDQGSADDQ